MLSYRQYGQKGRNIMKKVQAMVHSLNALDYVTIISENYENGVNEVIAEYKGKRCTAIFNPFSGYYYVDDLYGVIEDSD